MKKLIDPFRYFSGGATLAAGSAGMLLMVFLALWSGATFRGVVSQGFGDLAFWRLLLQQVAGWGVFSLLLYGAALLFSRSKIRAVDIFGNQALARVPFLLILIGSMVFPVQDRCHTTPPLRLQRINQPIHILHVFALRKRNDLRSSCATHYPSEQK